MPPPSSPTLAALVDLGHELDRLGTEAARTTAHPDLVRRATKLVTLAAAAAVQADDVAVGDQARTAADRGVAPGSGPVATVGDLRHCVEIAIAVLGSTTPAP